METNVRTEKSTYLITEVDTWKRKFQDLNAKYHNNHEELMMLKAENDALKRQGHPQLISV